MAYKVIILYRLYMPPYFLGTFTEYPNFTTLKVNFTMAKPQRITSSHTASWKARASLPDSAFWFMMAKAISCPLRALR